MKKRIWVIILAAITILIMVLSLTNVIEKSLGMCIALALIIVFNAAVAYYGYKSDVLLITVVMSILAVIGCILLGYNIVGYQKIHLSEEYDFQITVKEGNLEKTFLFSHGGYKYYVYKVENVEVTMEKDKKTYKLQDALNSDLVSLDKIKELAIPNSNTIGYQIYYDGGQDKYKNDQYSFVICADKKEVIFSTFDYVYSSEICN